MTLHRPLATRVGPPGPPGIPGFRFFRVGAVFGLSVLVGGVVLPVASLAFARESAPVCCNRGRCCCADDSVARDGRTCLRRGCGCEHGGQAVSGESPGQDAVLPAPVPVASAPPAQARWTFRDMRPIARARQPVVPPPRRPLPA